ncbi:MAG TPA: hypothetical protein PLU30_06055 [Verrucomicrobiae bacterium]|nr:hypothetical protein [Verrucomicrobiae bacterium]
MGVVMVVLLGSCARPLPFDTVLDDIKAFDGKTITAEGVRIEVPEKSVRTAVAIGNLMGLGDNPMGRSSFTTFRARTETGREFKITVPLANRDLLEKFRRFEGAFTTGKAVLKVAAHSVTGDEFLLVEFRPK